MHLDTVWRWWYHSILRIEISLLFLHVSLMLLLPLVLQVLNLSVQFHQTIARRMAMSDRCAWYSGVARRSGH